jgi:hypothetical protein
MPVVIETGFPGISQPLTHPRIGYQSFGGTITATSEAAGFPAVNAGTPVTYTAWKPAVTARQWELTFPFARSPEYLGIAAHRIASEGATVTVRKLTGGVWSNWGGGTFITPTNNDAILFLLDPQEVDGIGLQVTGGTPEIGVIRAGFVMEWPRLATWTGLPITESDQFRYNVNESESGNWLGRSKVSEGQEFQVEIDHLSETYRTSDFANFATHCNEGDATFWIAPRPQGYLNEVAYAWSTETVRAERNIPRASVANSVQLELKGHKTLS